MLTLPLFAHAVACCCCWHQRSARVKLHLPLRFNISKTRRETAQNRESSSATVMETETSDRQEEDAPPEDLDIQEEDAPETNENVNEEDVNIEGEDALESNGPSEGGEESEEDAMCVDKEAPAKIADTAENHTADEQGQPPNDKNAIEQRQRCGNCPGCNNEKRDVCTHCWGIGSNCKSCLERKCHVLYPIVKENGERTGSNGAEQPPSSSSLLDPASKRRKTNPQDGGDDRGHNSPTSEQQQTMIIEGGPKRGLAPPDTSQVELQKKLDELASAENSLAGHENEVISSTTVNALAPSNSKPFNKAPVANKLAGSSKQRRGSTATTSVSRSDTPIEVPKLVTLTSYLADTDYIKKDKRKAPPKATMLYGLEIPPEAPENVCSGCFGSRDEELEGKDVLLCDGPNCNREYHLACCIPTLPAVPDREFWLCQDCCPDGSTASLVEYLEAADTVKAEYLRAAPEGLANPQAAYVLHLIQKDMKQAGTPASRIPQSELDRSAMIHSLALCSPKELARTRGGNERKEALAPAAYLGKPVRIYNPLGNQYHTGRIVDYRTRGAPSFLEKSKASKSMRATEFLVRFAAGVDDRKKTHHHWIMLEEHSLAFGSTLVWAQIPAGSWNPAIVWLRTSRELVPVQKLLQEKDGEIRYQDEDGNPLSNEDALSPAKTSHRVFALTRTLGGETFSLINVRDMSVDVCDEAATREYLNESTNVLQFHIAKAELAEQQRVCNWRRLKQVNPFGPAALSSRDSHSLPALIPVPTDDSSNSINPAALCPNVSRGLDRAKILKLLKIRGIKPTKDVAASLACEIIPVQAKTIRAETMGRKQFL